MHVDFAKFAGSLPYASELYGIYQPLLGWKSKLTRARYDSAVTRFRSRYLERLVPRIRPDYVIRDVARDQASFEVRRGAPVESGIALQSIDSVVSRQVAALIAQNDPDDPTTWSRFTRPDVLDQLLQDSRDQIVEEYTRHLRLATGVRRTVQDAELTQVLSAVLARESMVTGALELLNRTLPPDALAELLRTGPANSFTTAVIKVLPWLDPDRSDIGRAVLSPIGIVHLFRQYFFEFDTFLGPPAEHIWLSPGGMVELIEVSTRKTIVERSVEQSIESIARTETSTMTQDELSDAVRNENASDTKLGVSANQSFNYGTAFVNGSTTVGLTFNIDEQQKTAREQTHRTLRQQTQTISSEIRKSYKTTVRTVTETTDLNSRRYVLQNTTDKLVNYELRRKMRQVGVQVQDYGTQLCWQTYVDEPGANLGVARLVHIAEPADLQSIKDPDLMPPPEPEIAGQPQTLSSEWIWEDSQYGFVPFLGLLQVVSPKSGYIFSRAQVIRVSGESWAYDVRPRTADDLMTDTKFVPDVQMIDNGSGGTERSVKSLLVGVQTDPSGLRTDSHPTNTVQVTLYFKPSAKLLHDIDAENASRRSKVNEEKARQLQDALFKAARDRIKAAGRVSPRPMTELREEERIVVYRALIQQLIVGAGVALVDHRTQHVFAEIVQSIFDVDRMLYFVAPEWWTPKRMPVLNPQNIGLGGGDLTAFTERNTVDWGGAKAARPDNYYITEDSTAAKLGSSLGWIIQLDGDNMRNAFLNAPWVKAVVPIRLGQEWKALRWLSDDSIEGADGLDALYEAKDATERTRIIAALGAHAWDDATLTARYAALEAGSITILDAIRYLILRIQELYAASLAKVVDSVDPAVSYLPTDRVFEHGFDPLQGGFRAQGAVPFEVFDQWIEVLPTDQIVPVEVTYDPKTGMQI